MELTAAYAERAGVGTLMRRCDARSQLVEATDLDFLQVRFLLDWHVRKTCAWYVLLARCGCAIGASPNARLKSEKIRYILPKLGKESVDLPDFAKDSVAILQIL